MGLVVSLTIGRKGIGQLQMLDTVKTHCALTTKQMHGRKPHTRIERTVRVTPKHCGRLQVYKEGNPAGQPLMSSSGNSGEQMEATLWRYINTSKPS